MYYRHTILYTNSSAHPFNSLFPKIISKKQPQTMMFRKFIFMANAIAARDSQTG